MPKSKRNKLIHLSATEKKTRESKSQLIESIRASMDSYPTCILFGIENSRNIFLQDVRNHFSQTSRFYFGKNKIMSKALGTTPEEEISPGIHELAQKCTGNVGLMFTRKDISIVQEYFESTKMIDFARTGGYATSTITLKSGPLMRGENDPIPHNMEPLVRSCGLPTSLVKGVVTLLKDYTIVNSGEKLTTSQAQLLKIFGIKMAESQVKIIGIYDTSNGYKEIK